MLYIFLLAFLWGCMTNTLRSRLFELSLLRYFFCGVVHKNKETLGRATPTIAIRRTASQYTACMTNERNWNNVGIDFHFGDRGWPMTTLAAKWYESGGAGGGLRQRQQPVCTHVGAEGDHGQRHRHNIQHHQDHPQRHESRPSLDFLFFYLVLVERRD